MSRTKEEKKKKNSLIKSNCRNVSPHNSHFIDWIKSIHLIRQRNSYQFASINRNSNNNNNLRFDAMRSILCVNIFGREKRRENIFNLSPKNPKRRFVTLSSMHTIPTIVYSHETTKTSGGWCQTIQQTIHKRIQDSTNKHTSESLFAYATMRSKTMKKMCKNRKTTAIEWNDFMLCYVISVFIMSNFSSGYYSYYCIDRQNSKSNANAVIRLSVYALCVCFCFVCGSHSTLRTKHRNRIVWWCNSCIVVQIEYNSQLDQLWKN